MALINTLLGQKDESELQRKDGLVDNEIEYTTTVEYCLKDCDGQAHKTRNPDSASHFCSKHIHRSADIKLKKPIVFAESAINGFQ